MTPAKTGQLLRLVLAAVIFCQVAASATAEAAKAPADAAEAAPDPEWMQRIDAAFGRYVVKPLAAVLFYDFGTGARWGKENSVPLVVVWLLVGAIYFTLRMGFINVRAFWHSVRLTKGDYSDPAHAGEVSHFQALASALAATLGLGNITGVAIAVAVGGPGAVFWLVVAGLLGMSSKFVECTLGVMYRKVDADGRVSGGPMHYLHDGLAELGLRPLGAVLAVVFAVMCIGGALGGGNAFQVSQSLGAIRQQVPLIDRQPWIYGAVLTVMVGIVIIGGIRRIAAAAEKIVPFMCALYVAACLYILAVHAADIPEAFAAIVRGAFAPDAMYGGAIGVMMVGIKRASFSNEAGIGSAAIAHAAARTDEPVSEGIVALLEPFIDTVVVCTMTGLVIVITGAHTNPANAEFVEKQLGGQLTSAAFGSVVDWFPYIVSVSVFLFAYATLIAWSYYGERCWTHLFGPRSSMVYKLIFLAFVMLGSVVKAKNVLDFSDMMILAMAFPNILGVALLSGKVKRALDDYWRRYKAGEFERR